MGTAEMRGNGEMGTDLFSALAEMGTDLFSALKWGRIYFPRKMGE
jgi:hypothetical protein